jgi:phosphonate transport system substrate-binding protein
MRLRDVVAVAAVALVLAGGGAAADWREDVKVLRIGFLAGDNTPYRSTQIEPFRAYMEGKIGIPVEMVPARTLGALIEAQAGARIQYAIHSAASFTAAEATCHCIEPLAVPAAEGGETGFHAVLLARSGSPIRSLADAKGTRIVLAGEDSIAGSLLPLKAFEREGIVPEQFFASIARAADPKTAIAMLLTGAADIAVGWSSLEGDFASGYSFGVLHEMVDSAELTMDEVRVVWQSDLIPFGPHAVRKDMPAELKSLVSDALLAMANEDPVALDAVDRSGGGGDAPVDAGAYAAIAALVAAPPGAGQ